MAGGLLVGRKKRKKENSFCGWFSAVEILNNVSRTHA